MIDKYLRAADEASAITALSSFGCRGVDSVGNEQWLVVGTGWALDVIGTIYTATGGTNADGTPEMVAVPGFHLNLRLTDESLAANVDATGLVIAAPATPYRVWAGGMVD